MNPVPEINHNNPCITHGDGHVPLRYLSVCSGMEAASVAWHPLGWKPVGFSEIEPFPCAILKHRFPNTPNYGSLTEHHTWPISTGDVDLLIGGTPCQAFSVAGLRRGLEDPRGNLALVFLGLADRIKPRWIVWENVPGVLSSNGGRDFGSFLGALVQLGYGFAYRVLDAQHFGVPQRRRRVFVVACLGDWRAPAEVLLESDCVRRDTKKGRAKGQGVASGAQGGVGADHPEGCWWDGGQVSQTLDAVPQKGQTMPEKNRFPAVLQPFTASSFAQYAEGVGTVRASGGDLGGGSETLLAEPIPYRKSKRAQSTTDDESWVPAEQSNTLNNFDLGDTRTTHAIVEPIAIQGTIIGRGENAGPQGTGATEGGPMFTLTKTDIHGVAQPTPIQDGRDMDKKQNGLGIAQPGDPSYTIDTTGAQSVAAAMAVRRLTPVETERLQGFPDNWSRIPWKGKPETECPDGPRYKACGNSMAVPVMRWIGKRIAEVEAKSRLTDA